LNLCYSRNLSASCTTLYHYQNWLRGKWVFWFHYHWTENACYWVSAKFFLWIV